MDALDCVALLCPLIQDPISLGGKEAVVFAILKRAGNNLSIIPRSLQTPDRPEFSTLTYQAKIPSLVPSFLAYCQQQHDPFIFPVTTT